MARQRSSDVGERRRKPATTPEAREQELVSLAFDLAERQIREGTASSQVITHFVKAGSIRERLEQQRITHENEMTQVKIDAMRQAEAREAVYEEALKAMRAYSGQEPAPDESHDENPDIY